MLTADRVFWGSAFGGAVFGMPKGGGATTTYASGLVFGTPHDAANGKLFVPVDANCGAGAYVLMFDIASGARTTVIDNLDCAAVAHADSCSLYVSSRTRIDRVCLTADCSSTRPPSRRRPVRRP